MVHHLLLFASAPERPEIPSTLPECNCGTPETRSSSMKTWPRLQPVCFSRPASWSARRKSTRRGRTKETFTLSWATALQQSQSSSEHWMTSHPSTKSSTVTWLFYYSVWIFYSYFFNVLYPYFCIVVYCFIAWWLLLVVHALNVFNSNYRYKVHAVTVNFIKNANCFLLLSQIGIVRSAYKKFFRLTTLRVTSNFIVPSDLITPYMIKQICGLSLFLSLNQNLYWTMEI